MAITESQKQATYKYHREKIKRVPLDMQKKEHEKLVKAASAAGMSVNGYIKKAISEKMEREQGPE